MTVIFSDLHLRRETADICDRVLDFVGERAGQSGHIVFTGDFYMVRYQLDVRLQNMVKGHLDTWREQGIEVDIVPGNHDQVDVDGQNALQIFEAYDNVRVWTDPGSLLVGHTRFGFMPYRKSGVTDALKALAAEDPDLIFAHLSAPGSVVNNGHKCEHPDELPAGLPPLILGHYHKHQQSTAKVGAFPAWQYVGSPYQTSYGEVGNVSGILELPPRLPDGSLPPPIFVDLEKEGVFAPRHFILEWDPAANPEPPSRPGRDFDNVWLKIKASRTMLVDGKFKGVLKTQGLDDVRVSVDPLPVERDHRFQVPPGEELIVSAERFANERVGGCDDADARAITDASVLMEALRRWQ